MSRLLSIGILQQARNGGGAPAPWTPANLANLFAWYDPSDLSTITEVSGAVSQYDDKSGNNYHLKQATAADQPSTGVNTLNGLNVITFGGGSEKLFTDFNIPTQTASSILMVARASATNQTIFGFLQDGNTMYRLSQIFSLSGYINVYDDNIAPKNANGGALQANTYVLLTATSQINGDVTMQVNNATPATTTTGTTSFNVNSFVMGSLGSAGSTFALIGDVAEVIVTNDVIGSTDKTDAKNYLATKWGITL